MALTVEPAIAFGVGFCLASVVSAWAHARQASHVHAHPHRGTDPMQRPPTIRATLEAVLHQLATDSDLDDKVSAPEKYDALERDVRGALAELDEGRCPEGDDPIDRMDPEEARRALRMVRDALWFDAAENAYDPDKGWSPDTIGEVAVAMTEAGATIPHSWRGIDSASGLTPPPVLHRCCAPDCPGYPWRASDATHPCAS